ncbi:MAG: hypothetical protein JWP91_995 [Fibrobacteres bacterium]|nr:hypothetical protein [Fibrobacterota bacterium]
MLHKPRKSRTFSRYVMGGVFLLCGMLLATQNLLAGGVFLPLAAIILYYAPRWDLRIEITGQAIRFSENVLETYELELKLDDIAEIRRVEEREERKGFLTSYPEFYPFVEFETRAGRTYRMHDIFDEAFDEEILRRGGEAGITLSAFSRPDAEEDGPSGDVPA